MRPLALLASFLTRDRDHPESAFVPHNLQQLVGQKGETQVQFSPNCSNGKARQAAIGIVVCAR
jgi:hypothetical protein